VASAALPTRAGRLRVEFPKSRSLNQESRSMAKPQRKLKKANHGKRPASSKARRKKRWAIHT